MAKKDASKILGRDLLDGLGGRDIQTIEVPDFGGRVHVRPMSLGTHDLIEKAGATRGMIIRHSVCDAQGGLLFTDEDIPRINDLSGKALGPLVKAILEMNGMTAKAQEEAAGN